jgi:hypothetical protein
MQNVQTPTVAFFLWALVVPDQLNFSLPPSFPVLFFLYTSCLPYLTKLGLGPLYLIPSAMKCKSSSLSLSLSPLLMNFYSFLSLEQLTLMGFDTMTPVQAGAIPLFMKNKDVVVEVRRADRLMVRYSSTLPYRRWQGPGKHLPLWSPLSKNFYDEKILWRITKSGPWSLLLLGKSLISSMWQRKYLFLLW